MAFKTDTLAVVFADISGSTQLYESLGDAQAREKAGLCVSLLIQTVRENNGTVIKTMGDEVLSTFPNADAAIVAAIQMQRRVREEFSRRSVKLKLHIGIHFGAVLLEGSDVFGDSVNIAARMVQLAKDDQVLATRSAVEAFSQPSATNIRKLGRLPVKGKQERMYTYEILWKGEEQERTILSAQSLQMMDFASLLLRYGDEEIKLNAERPTAVIGRDAENDLVINNKLTSRRHARIEYRTGKFILIDESTNGTFVLTNEGQTIDLRREETLLWGTGQISLGQRFGEDPTDVMHFKLQSDL